MKECEKSLLEHEIELEINKQMLADKLITHEIYSKVASMILKDIEVKTRELDKINV